MARLSPATGTSLKARQRLALTPQLRQSIAVLSMRGAGLRRLAEEIGAENPLLDISLPETATLSSHGQHTSWNMEDIAQHAAHPVTLAAHLFGQISMAFTDTRDRALALALVEHVSPAGWLDPSGVAAARAMGIEGEDFERLLQKLHELEPAGIFARNLAECLRIQLADQGMLSDAARSVLAHLDQLTADGMAGLARATGLTLAEIEQVLARLRSCNPRPGAGFLVDNGDIFRPDLIIEKDDAGYSLSVNEATLPRIAVVPAAGEDDAATRLLRKKAQEEASWLNAAIRQRSAMLLEAGAILIRVQGGFLDNGDLKIKPFRMRDLAEEMGCHKSTVSRLVADKLCQTPRGMIALKDFFAASVDQPDGRKVAGRAITARIMQLVAGEDMAAPLTDDELAEKLAMDGMVIARRTIAKYRQGAGILNWRDRRHAKPNILERKS